MSVTNINISASKHKLLRNNSSETIFPQIPSGRYSRSSSPNCRAAIFNKYHDLIRSKSNISLEAEKSNIFEVPFDFDDEEYAFSINILNKNVACVGKDIAKQIQSAQEPWPDNVKLFQPYEVEQILLPDNASCLAVQAFLKMCGLPFEVEMRWNAEFMSPSGRVPFIKCGAFVVSELEPIVQFVANKRVSLCSDLTQTEKADMRAYMSMITNVLVNAELYVSWIDEATFNNVTKVRNSSVYAWPLGWLQTRSKRNAVTKRLKALNWHSKTMDQVMADVEQCCETLSQILGDKDFFFGKPTPLDALVYGHMRALLSAKGPKAHLFIQSITMVLLKHVVRVAKYTEMELTQQEQYLVSQANNIYSYQFVTPEKMSALNSRLKKSKLGITNADDVFVKDGFGYKPFASKQLKLVSNKKDFVTCEYNPIKMHLYNKLIKNEIVQEIIDDVISKGCEVIGNNIDKSNHVKQSYHDNESINHDANDFEVIHDNGDFAKYDYLNTIQELDSMDTTLDTTNEDLIQVIEEDVYLDSDCAVVGKIDGTKVEEKSSNYSIRSLRPTELDAVVFGHVFTIITTRLPFRRLAEIVRKHESLVSLAKRVDETYFRRP